MQMLGYYPKIGHVHFLARPSSSSFVIIVSFGTFCSLSVVEFKVNFYLPPWRLTRKMGFVISVRHAMPCRETSRMIWRMVFLCDQNLGGRCHVVLCTTPSQWCGCDIV